MNERDNVQREKWLMEAIAGLEQVIDSGNLSDKDAFRRILREYQDELKAMKEKGEQSPLSPQ